MSETRRSTPAVIGAVAVIAVGAPTLLLLSLGPLATQMAIHIALMNVAAPLLAVCLAWERGFRLVTARWLWPATATQLLLLWVAHAPSVHQATMASIGLQAGLWALLFASAMAFWASLISDRAGVPWREILSLMLTGKLACLLAALLVFAPRPIYAIGHHGMAALSDQQLAGLLMLAACPLSYVLAGIALAARMLARRPAAGDTSLIRQMA